MSLHLCANWNFYDFWWGIFCLFWIFFSCLFSFLSVLLWVSGEQMKTKTSFHHVIVITNFSADEANLTYECLPSDYIVFAVNLYFDDFSPRLEKPAAAQYGIKAFNFSYKTLNPVHDFVFENFLLISSICSWLFLRNVTEPQVKSLASERNKI